MSKESLWYQYHIVFCYFYASWFDSMRNNFKQSTVWFKSKIHYLMLYDSKIFYEMLIIFWKSLVSNIPKISLYSVNSMHIYWLLLTIDFRHSTTKLNQKSKYLQLYDYCETVVKLSKIVLVVWKRMGQ